MKKLVPYLGVAVLGSALTLGAAQFLNTEKSEPDTVRVEHVNSTPARGAMYTVDEQGDLIPLDFTAAADKVMHAVVHITSTSTASYQSNPQYRTLPDPFRQFFEQSPNTRQRPQVGTGSGVIINKDGYIITNNHVVANADDIEVVLNDNRSFKAKLVGTDPNTDLALLQIQANDLPYLSFVNSDDVKVGEWVLAVGNPFNLNSTVTAGIVSAKGRSIRILDSQSPIESFIQTDAAINPGNSGGALVNLNGDLIGINTAIASPTGSYSGYGFAVPSNLVNKVVEDLLEYGTVQRAYLGVFIRDVDSDIAAEENLDRTNGVFVDSVMANSAALAAGIEEGDVITAIDGTSISSVPELQERIGRRRPGDQVSITIDRNGRNKDLVVTLNNQNGNTEVVAVETMGVLERLDASFEAIDARTARKLGIKGGVKVVDMPQNSILQRSRAREGYIIVEVNDQPVTSIEELETMLRKREGKPVTLKGVYEDYPGTYYVVIPE